jgi:anti-anti-sigma factor
VIETQLLADSSIVCRPLGSLDWIAAASLRHVMGDSLRPGVVVIIDLSRVEFVDAVGITATVGSLRRMRAVGGRTDICGASPEVRRRLQLTGVDRPVMRCSTTSGNDDA